MQAEQRAKIDKGHFEPQDSLWQPFTVHGDDGGDRRPLEVEATDAYVVVEDIGDGSVIFEISQWPRLDRDGRLFFDSDPSELLDDLDGSQGSVDTARADQGVTAPDRRLRIGDVLAVRGLAEDATAIGDADVIWDISLAGRNAAKAALYGAAASTIKPDYEEEMAISGELEEAPPESGSYDVRQVMSKVDPQRRGRGRRNRREQA